MQPEKPLRILVAAFDQGSEIKHGGVRRATQICRLAGADVVCVVPPVNAVPLHEALLYMSHGLTQMRNIGLPPLHALRAAFAIGYVYLQIRQRGVHFRSANFLIEICRGANTYIAYWLAKRRIRFSVAPQNVESLVPNHRLTRRDELLQYRMERRIYERAHCALCISDVDTFIVRCLGATAVTVPYFPDPDDVVRFDGIRAVRHRSTDEYKLLYVGTAHNSPTLAGAKRLVERFTVSLPEPWTLHVVGYGTDHACGSSHPRVVVEGAVSDTRLSSLLATCSAVLLHQPATTGFLTRLVEMNLCGIPSFVNEEYLPAAGLEHYGVHTYRDLKEVGRMVAEIGAEGFEKFKPMAQIEADHLRTRIWKREDGRSVQDSDSAITG